MSDSPWRTITPGDASTLPTEADAAFDDSVNVCRGRTVGTEYWHAVSADDWDAWMPIPPYTPPEPVKRCYVSGDSEDIALVFEAVNSRIDTSGSWTHQAELRDLSRRLWKTNIDPDAAIRLRELASEVVRKHDAGTLGGSGDSRSINELREAVK